MHSVCIWVSGGGERRQGSIQEGIFFNLISVYNVILDKEDLNNFIIVSKNAQECK